MVDKFNSSGESKAGKEPPYENVLVIVVLIFSFIYFLFQLYSWLASP